MRGWSPPALMVLPCHVTCEYLACTHLADYGSKVMHTYSNILEVQKGCRALSDECRTTMVAGRAGTCLALGRRGSLCVILVPDLVAAMESIERQAVRQVLDGTG